MPKPKVPKKVTPQLRSAHKRAADRLDDVAEKLEAQYQRYAAQPGNPWLKGWVTRRQNALASSMQSVARTREIVRQRGGIVKPKAPPPPPKPEKPIPKFETTRQLVDIDDVGYASVVVSNMLNPQPEHVQGVLDSIDGGYRTPNLTPESGELENIVFSTARHAITNLLPGAEGEFLADRFADSLANITGRSAQQMITNDARAARKVVARDIRDGVIQREQADKFLKKYLGLNAMQIRAVDNFEVALARQGYNKRDRTRLINERIANMRVQRAQVIADVERMRAVNLGQQFAWEHMVENGQMDEGQRKMWIANGDELTCDECYLMNGRITNVLRSWNTNTRHEIVKTPPMHPRCRCLIQLVD